ncbi:MAG: NADH-quinone oxidoreductase subunit F, partial [Methanobacterium sp.]|nr:NADH-quinone oxidoreductase subunit F [Methanobacterium sp.]
MNFKQLLDESEKEYKSIFKGKNPVILVGSATCGNSAGANLVIKSFNKELEKHGLDVEIIEVGCLGLCHIEPIITIIKPGKPAIFYGNINQKLVTDLVKSYLLSDNPIPEIALGTYKGKIKGIPDIFSIPVLKPQVRQILRNCGFIDPKNIKHYIACGGYKGLKKALEI